MPEKRRVDVVKEIRVILGRKRLHRLLARDERDRGDIVERSDLRLNGTRLIFRERLIDIGDDLVLVLQAVNILVDVERQH